jgi:hypothetical protein
VRERLVARGVACWMDIDGGMRRNVYDSMAEGVTGAGCVVAFMSAEYERSENCRLELQFAKQVRLRACERPDPRRQAPAAVPRGAPRADAPRGAPAQSGVPIVPAMTRPPPYKAQGWLGVVTAGALWTPLHDPAAVESGIDQLVQQIRMAMPVPAEARPEGAGELTPTARLCRQT